MAPVPMLEMLDELAVDVMDLQSQLAEEPKIKHKQLIRKMLDKVFMSKKYQSIPEFEKGKKSFLRVFFIELRTKLRKTSF